MKRIYTTVFAALTVFCLALGAPTQSDAERMKSGMMNPGADLRTADRSGGGTFKVLVYGNSIALHGPKPDIGWTNNWGMAASARENDFAHLVAAGLEKKRGSKADLRIRNLAALERNFTTNIATVAQISADVKWEPDYVVIAIGENVPNLTASTKEAYRKFLADIGRPFASLPKRPKIVLRSPFWQSSVKADCTKKAAADIGAVYVYAGALGPDPENRALGRFWHDGVANHPGDLGMRRLADLILKGFEVVAFGAAAQCGAGEFTARFAGQQLRVHPARVSAFPMNQVWAGYQRPVEQTKMSSFVSFDMDSPGELTILPPAGEENAEPIILPLSWKPRMRRDGCALRIAVDRPRQFTVSFGTSGKVLHVFANPSFNEPHGKDEIVFGPGEHHVGVVVPKSGQTVRIEEGAVVYGAILVAHAKDVTITGRGIVDGSFLNRADTKCSAHQAAVKAGIPEGFYGAQMAVTTFTCAWSTNVVVRGVTFRDPPRWTMIVRAQSKDVLIENVKIVGCWRYNADGINVCASENVVIRDSFVRSFDDCIITRGAYLDCGTGPTRNVTVERCVLWCDWGKCLEVWAGHKPCLIENVLYRDIACIATDRIGCDVTTWFASPSTRIRNIVMEEIEFDFAYPRYAPQLQQSREDVKFRFGETKTACLLCVDVQSYGRYLGNQKHEPAKDLSGFKVQYENFAFRRFKTYGDVPHFTGRIDATSAPHTIKGLETEGLPDGMSLSISGDVTMHK